MTCSGRLEFFAISVIGSDEVLLAKIHFSLVADSVSAKTFIFNSTS
jgi:hypothetical protein